MSIFFADVKNFPCPHCYTLWQSTYGLHGSDGKAHAWCNNCGEFTGMEINNPEFGKMKVMPHCCIDGCKYQADFLVADMQTGDTDAFCKFHWPGFIHGLSSKIGE